MIKPHLPRLLSIMALGACPVVAQEIELKKALPSDSLMFVSFPDIRASLAEMEEMPLMKMWNEGEVQDFFADGLKLLETQREMYMAQGKQMHDAGMLPVNPEELLKLRVDRMSMAVARLGVEQSQDAPPMPVLSMFAHFDFGESAEQWKGLVDMLVQMGPMMLQPMDANQPPPIAMEDSTIGEVSLKTIRSTMDGPPISLNLAWVGTNLVIGTHTGDTKDLIGRLTGGEGGLTQSDAYEAIASRLDRQGAEAEVFVRPGALIDFALMGLNIASSEGALPPEISVEGINRAVDALGLRSIQGMGMSTAYAKDRSVTKSFTHAPEDQRKGLTAMSSGTIGLDFLRWVPKDAVTFSATSMDVAALYDGILNAVRAYDEDLAQMLLGQLSQMEQQLGVSLREDLIGSMGQQLVTWSMPMAGFGAMTPEMGIVMEMREPDRFMRALEAAAKMSQGAIELDKIERRGLEAHQLRFNFDLGNTAMPMNPLASMSPTFVFDKGMMVAAFTSSDLRRTMARLEREDDPSGDIRSNEAFAPLLSQLPEDGVTSVSFTDWKAQFEGYYQMMTSMLVFVPIDQNVPIDLALLPDASTLTQHLSGSLTWGVQDKDGFSSTTVSPWGPETGVLMSALAGAGFGAASALMGDTPPWGK